MKFQLVPSLVCLALAFSACANPINLDGDDDGDANSDGAASGGSSLIGSSGGSVSATGGAVSTGGATATGGAASSGTGGAVVTTFDGQCAGKPAYAAWKSGTGQATGDEVVFICTKVQGACVGATVGEPYLVSCNQSHVGNCTTQIPDDTNAWTLVGACSDEGLGGGGS